MEVSRKVVTGPLGAEAEADEIEQHARVPVAGGENAGQLKLAEHEKVVHLRRQVFPGAIGDAADGHQPRATVGADTGDGAGFHVRHEGAGGLVEALALGGAQDDFRAGQDFAQMDREATAGGR